MSARLRIGFIGAGSIVPTHMQVLRRLGRAGVVAICSRHEDHARALADDQHITVYTDPELMLRNESLDAVFVCVPPYVSPQMCQLLVSHDIPFLVEKPVAALDPGLACQIADEVERRDLVTAVGYQLRGMDFLNQVRDAIAAHTPELLVARWFTQTPRSEWWDKDELSGGQVVEQMTHFYDLSRALLGEPTVIAARTASGATSALIQFQSGTIGTLVNTHHAQDTIIDMDLVSIGKIWLDTERSVWNLTPAGSAHSIATKRSPYEVQAAAFLDAVETHDPSRVLATYRDGLATYLVTRSVVAVDAS